MTDPFEVRTTGQRAVVLVALLAYFALFVVEFTIDNPDLVALRDLVVAALAIPASLVIVRRATAGADADVLALFAGVSFLVAGLGVGYSGVAALSGLPVVPAVEVVGSLALIVGVGLYLYYTWA